MKYCFYLLAVLFLCSCSDNELFVESATTNDSGEIRLNANFRGGSANSRGIGPITGTKPTSDLPIDMYRADATSAKVYTDVKYTKLDATMTKTSGTIGWTSQQYWLTDPTKYTKLIGLYPAVTTDKYTQNSGTITYTLDGATDIICSQLIEGYRGNTNAIPMTFKHLLTQVKVTIVSNNTAVPGKWGTVSKVAIKNKKGNCLVTLPVATTSTSPAVTASVGTLSNVANVDVTTSSGGTISTAADIPTNNTAKVFGYAMFPPCTEALTLYITTGLGGTQEKILPSQTFAAGYAYEIKINFTLTNVALTASITDWATGNTITADL